MQVKQPSTYDEQLNILKSRGMVIQNDDACLLRLQEIGYYRLSGYTLPFKTDAGFKPGTTFDQIVQLYQLDSNLRSIFFSCIEEIEIYLRSCLSYYHAHKYGPLGYEDAANFSRRHDQEVFKNKYMAEINNNSSVLFVQHHLSKYNGCFPLWVLMELFTFGMISYFYSDMHLSDRKDIAHDLYDTIPDKLSSWLRCCTDLRNICSHYGRLYFRTFSAAPSLPITEFEKRRLWGYVCMLKELFPDKNKWDLIVVPRILGVISTYHEYIDLTHVAFPADWKKRILH